MGEGVNKGEFREKLEVEDYPYPIAHPYNVATDEDKPPYKRFMNLIFTYQQVLRVLTLPMVGQYLTSDMPTEEMPQKDIHSVNQAIARLRSPGLRDWETLFHTLLNHLGEGKGILTILVLLGGKSFFRS